MFNRGIFQKCTLGVYNLGNLYNFPENIEAGLHPKQGCIQSKTAPVSQAAWAALLSLKTC